MITVGRVRAIEITLNWRWLPVLALASWLLAQTVLPARFPRWEMSTNWLTSVAAVLAGEIALLLHELSHALVARGRGQEVTRIVFHGLRAETVLAEGLPTPAQEALIALVGPGVNVALAALAQAVRLATDTQGPVDVFLLTLVLGNAAMAAMSLVPISGSDGARTLGALRRTRRDLRPSGSGEAEVTGEGHDQDDQDDQTERRPAVIPPTARHSKPAT
jgi:Zn-dependent protease